MTSTPLERITRGSANAATTTNGPSEERPPKRQSGQQRQPTFPPSQGDKSSVALAVPLLPLRHGLLAFASRSRTGPILALFGLCGLGLIALRASPVDLPWSSLLAVIDQGVAGGPLATTPPHALALLALVAFIGSMAAAVFGFGPAVMLLPLLIWALGVREAVPILTIGQILGNAERVWPNRKDIAWPVTGWYLLGSIPLSLIGGLLFVQAPTALLHRLLGLFFLVVIAHRFMAKDRIPGLPTRGFALVGAGAGFLSGLIGGTGPLLAPFYLSYGLVRAAYIGTDGVSMLVTHSGKLFAYGPAGLLDFGTVMAGLALGGVMMLGAAVGKQFLDHVHEGLFVRLVEGCVVVAGLQFLIWA
jgi:uncharacterized protein